MRRLACLFGVVLLSAFGRDGEPLGAPIKTAVLAHPSLEQRSPRFRNGFFLTYDFDRPTVWSFDAAGRQLMEVPLSMPGIAKILIKDVAAAVDGTVVAATSASTARGEWVALLFWIEPNGRIARVVRTSPFGLARVTFASDGSLWAAGVVKDSQYRELPEYDMLCQYSVDGRLLRTALPRTSFRQQDWPSIRVGLMLAGRDRICLYIPSASEWVEVSLSGVVVDRRRVNPIAENVDLVSGGLVGSSGSVYVGTSSPTVQAGAQPGTPQRNRRLDKTSGTFVPVAGQPALGSALIIGSDGNHLVFYQRPGTFWWVRAD